MLVNDNNGVSVHPYSHPPQEKVLKHLTYVWDGGGMQFEKFYSLNHTISVEALFAVFHHPRFQPTLSNLGKVCDKHGVSVHPYGHSLQDKVLKHFIYVKEWNRIQFETYYSLLNHSQLSGIRQKLWP